MKWSLIKDIPLQKAKNKKQAEKWIQEQVDVKITVHVINNDHAPEFIWAQVLMKEAGDCRPIISMLTDGKIHVREKCSASHLLIVIIESHVCLPGIYRHSGRQQMDRSTVEPESRCTTRRRSHEVIAVCVVQGIQG